MALDKTWVEPLPGAIPDTNKVTTNPLGVEEDTYYLITASSTETTLGQKGLHKMIKAWLDPKVAKIEKILTSSYVKEITDQLWS